MTGYQREKEAIKAYARDLRNHAPDWSKAGYELGGAKVDPEVFTSSGTAIFNAYENLVEDYAWNAWRISVTLEKAAEALDITEEGYGRAEATIQDDINNLGKQL